MDDGDLYVKPGVVIPASELSESASRASGPGGQHVNKANTRVTLRWCLRESAALSPSARRRAEERLGGRVTRAGALVIHAASQRSRERNRAAARARLAELLREALHTDAPRVATKPGKRARARLRDAKKRRSATKSGRRAVRRGEDA